MALAVMAGSGTSRDWMVAYDAPAATTARLLDPPQHPYTFRT
jgi:hypothetical protein